jgi:protein-S-isoprenylcysteine O-methyltransferase Ste14
MRRWSFYLYGIGCYLLFFAVFAYFFGFVGNVLVPKTIDSSPSGSVASSAAIDLLLVVGFALQHSVMARPGFKRIWTRIVPTPIERSTYVLASCVVTIVLMWQWRAIDMVVWDVRNPLARTLLWGLFASGWLLVPGVSLMISHTDLFGLRQVWLHLRGREYTPLPFRTPMLYASIRHPLYVGWATAFWVTPTMTVGHLLLAVTMTAYMALAVLFEERDLAAYFGHQYEDYRRRVPKFVPRLTRPPVAVASRPLVTTPQPAAPHRGSTTS